MLVKRQFQAGAVEECTGEFVAEIEVMRTAAENGVEQLVLEAGGHIQLGGVATKKHHLHLGVGIGIDQSQLKPVQLLFVIVH